jgi:uncharacterized protein (DUF58 family)
MDRRYRWRVALGSSLVLAGAGIWLLSPALIVAAAAPLAFIIYSALSTAPPAAASVTLNRTITPARTYPGGAVDVELTVTNERDNQLLDVRIVDGVPAELAVIEGSPRAALSMNPGATTSIEYAVRARYGEFEFQAPTIRTHSLSGSVTDTVEPPAAGDARLAATLDPEEYPLGQQTTGVAGELSTDRAGEGLEFHGIRSYQPEDPMNRINWRQYARERQLSTIDYRQEEAVEVVVAVDARASTRVARNETAPTGTELSVYVAGEVIGGLLQNRNQVGAAVLGVDGRQLPAVDAAGEQFAWVTPGSDREARTRITSVLDAAAATVRPETIAEKTTQEPTGDDGDAAVTDSELPVVDPLEIVRRIHTRIQVVLVTPLCDEYPIDLVRQLRSTGHTVTVYTPDVTARTTPGGQVATTQRTLRVTELRRLGVTVVDWNPGEPLTAAFERSDTPLTTSLTQP